MSHEIRTPLNGVVGMIDALQAGGLNEVQQRYAKIACDAVAALMTVINDILDFSKIEAGKVEIESVEFDPHDLLDSLIELFTSAAAKKGLLLTGEVSPDVPRRCVGDPNRVRQVLTNLLNNAIKFTKQGQVSVRMVLERHEADRIVLRTEVKDTGIGIPVDRLDRLFKSFSQVDSSTTRKYGGTGLGLVISKRLAELMGGQMTVQSRENDGTTIAFTLNLAQASGQPQQDERKRAALSRDASDVLERIKGSHLLVAEDNEMNQFVTEEMLKRAGCTCEIVSDGLQAFEAAGEKRFDVVLMDCQMPRLDGFGSTARIRRREAATAGSRRIPIVALTAEAIAGDRERCLAAGMDGYVSKPIDAGELFATIASLIERRPDTAAPDENGELIAVGDSGESCKF